MASGSSNGHDSQHAPRYTVPGKSVTLVEHPFVVKNVDKAIDILGGSAAVGDAITSSKPLNLSFDPRDPTSRKISSLTAPADNVLLRITVPKRIGKRKRGSNDAFTPIATQVPVLRDSKHLRQSMTDNKAKTTIEAIGSIQKTHVWRSMPDFDYSNQGSAFLSGLQSKVLPQRYDLLQQWEMSRAMGSANPEITPLPTFSNVSLPEPYNFYQRPQNTDGDGERSDQDLVIQGSRRTQAGTVTCTSNEAFPLEVPDDMPKLELQNMKVQNLVKKFRPMFAERSVWTKRALGNVVEGGLTQTAVTALRYIAFTIKSGAWCSTYCAFGVDPRLDVNCRKYQTLTIITDRKNKDTEASSSDSAPPAQSDGRSHIFTGQRSYYNDGNTFQLCDLEDPQLKTLVDVDESQLSKTCDNDIFGWYGNGTFTKIRVVLRTKLHAIRDGKPTSDSDFAQLLTFPDHYYPGGQNPDPAGGPEQGHMVLGSSRRQTRLAAAYRQGCSNNGRMKFKDDVEDDTSSDIDEGAVQENGGSKQRSFSVAGDWA